MTTPPDLLDDRFDRRHIGPATTEVAAMLAAVGHAASTSWPTPPSRPPSRPSPSRSTSRRRPPNPR